MQNPGYCVSSLSLTQTFWTWRLAAFVVFMPSFLPILVLCCDLSPHELYSSKPPTLLLKKQAPKQHPMKPRILLNRTHGVPSTADETASGSVLGARAHFLLWVRHSTTGSCKKVWGHTCDTMTVEQINENNLNPPPKLKNNTCQVSQGANFIREFATLGFFTKPSISLKQHQSGKLAFRNLVQAPPSIAKKKVVFTPLCLGSIGKCQKVTSQSA